MPDTKTANLNTIRAAFMRRASAPDINALALKLAYLIAYKHMDSKIGKTFVAQETLARDLNVTERQVRRMLDILQPLGLVIVPGHGANHRASTYWIDPDEATANRTPESGSGPANRTSVSGRKPANRTFDPLPTGHLKTANRTPESALLKKNLQEDSKKEEYISEPLDVASPDSGEDARSNPDRKTKPDNISLDPDADRRAVDNVNSAFADFWAAYPKRVAKAQAEKAFAAAIKRGADPAALIEGAKRYADERVNQDPKFTKHPATWLNAECWLDEPSAPVTIDQQGNVIETPQPRRSKTAEEEDAEILAEYVDPSKSWERR